MEFTRWSQLCVNMISIRCTLWCIRLCMLLAIWNNGILVSRLSERGPRWDIFRDCRYVKVIPNQGKTYEKMTCEEEERERKMLKGTSLILLSEKITCTERAPAECWHRCKNSQASACTRTPLATLNDKNKYYILIPSAKHAITNSYSTIYYQSLSRDFKLVM